MEAYMDIDDKDDVIYNKIGNVLLIIWSIIPMITVRSNPATNVPIEIADAKKQLQLCINW
jgi:hypothetical protein